MGPSAVMTGMLIAGSSSGASGQQMLQAMFLSSQGNPQQREDFFYIMEAAAKPVRMADWTLPGVLQSPMRVNSSAAPE